ncbi:MAG: MBL fold metallo-hydrolase [Gemmatimonadaceae bacterium]|nr:MBL fold metallo-hydrolase [Gemmatimonadaceae bacterium]
MLVRQIFDASLAQYAYLIGCPRTGDAIVFDPERDIDRYYEIAARHKLRIVAAADTHIHADYVSGLREFAERGVTVYASDEGGADWRYEWLLGSTYPHHLVHHGDQFRVGNIGFTVLHTPGHTPEHVCYSVVDHGSGADEAIGVVTGDFVFVGDLGRPDLLEQAAGVIGTMEPGARQLYHSLDILKSLPEHTQIWPAHGAGSACGKSLGDVPTSTVGYERRFNPAVRAATSENAFVEYILSGQPEPPMYFARMKRDNKIGPRVIGHVPAIPHLDADTIGALGGRTDVAVLDTRGRKAFLAAHLPKSLLCELDYQFTNIAGSYVNEGEPIYLIIDEDRVDQAVRELIRIGLDDIRGYITPAELDQYLRAGGPSSHIDSISMETLEARRVAGGVRVLDVRGKVDFDVSHIPGAMNIAHTRLLARIAELPHGQPVLVHCNSGARSAHAVALLERYGFEPVNVADMYANWRATATVGA